jgi:uncharacterized protein
MGKIIFWLGIFAAIYIALKAVAVIKRKGALDAQDQNTRPAADGKDEPETKVKALASLVSCAKCGVHLPSSEAIQSGNQFFCSKEHAD